MKRNEQVLWAMTDLGDDLIDTAERIRFAKPLWRQLLPLAACLAVALGAWQIGKQIGPIQAEPTPSVAEEVQEAVPPEIHTSPTKAAYILDVSAADLRMIAVDEKGELIVEAERLEFITDRISGDRLAILATPVYGADSDWKSAERIVYDLFGKELCRLNARKIQCVGDVVAVTYHSEHVSLYHRDGTLLQDGFPWAVSYGDCMVVGHMEDDVTRRYYGPDGALLVTDTVDDDLIVFDMYSGERTLFCKRDNSGIGLVDLNGNWVIEPKYTEYGYVNDTCVRCKDAAGNWVLVSLETGETIYQIGPVEQYVEPFGAFLFRMGEDGGRWEDWQGNVIVPTAPRVQAVDDDKDGEPELFLADELNGTTIYYGTDGTERLRVTGSQNLETLSSRAAAGIWVNEAGQTELRLIDLHTGEEYCGFDKDYVEVARVAAYGEARELVAGTFYAWYKAEDGARYADLIDEDGNILLEHLRESREGFQPHIGGGVFCVRDGYQYIDGTWLYRE